jgi:hypothetical protein
MDDILTLAEMAAELGLSSADGLRTQVHRGRLAARLIGKTWVVTRAEVDRYRQESLGQVGRPPTATATNPMPIATAHHIGPPKATASNPLPKPVARRR